VVRAGRWGARASAVAVRVSQGDAQTIFQGGSSLAGFTNPGLIRPFEGSPWDGRHFCALDWHVIAVAVLSDVGSTRQEFEAYRSTVSIAFVLDGRPLATEQTATKRLQTEAGTFFYVQQGSVLAPDELEVGQHQLSMDFSDDEVAGVSETITFFIDAAGTGACL
jgi:hypothetical protein